MTPTQAVPLLIIIIAGLLVGLLIWGFVLSRGHINDATGLADASGNWRLWLLLLGVFSLGAFIVYTLEIFILNR